MESATNQSQLASNLFEGLYTLDRDRHIITWNRAAQRITGYSADEVIGSKCSDNILIHVDSEGTELCKDSCPVSACIEDGEFREASVFLHHKMGHRVPVDVRVFPLRDLNGETRGGVELFIGTDSIESMALKISALESQALIDSLTNLPNRKYIKDGIDASIALYNRMNRLVSIVFIDIDNMKSINDIYGHNAGDSVLETLARTIASCARPSDIFGRWGGDEFVGYLPGSNLQGALKLAQRLSRLIACSNVQISDEESIKVTASIGVSVIRENDTVLSLIDRADKAMYKAIREFIVKNP